MTVPSGRSQLGYLLADLRLRLDAIEDHLRNLPDDTIAFGLMEAYWPAGGWHWNGEEGETLEAFVLALVARRDVDPDLVLDRYFAAWGQSERLDITEVPRQWTTVLLRADRDGAHSLPHRDEKEVRIARNQPAWSALRDAWVAARGTEPARIDELMLVKATMATTHTLTLEPTAGRVATVAARLDTIDRWVTTRELPDHLPT